jgi:Rab GDP dissociation inhibitor
LGTGLTECILSGILSVEGKKVLHIDQNDYYGADCASLSLTKFYQQFNAEPPKNMGKDRDWNIDLVPKFMMAAGELADILVHTGVTRYLEFKQIDGSFVYRGGKISKVPATEMEALKSPLMGFFEKRRAKKFFEFIQLYHEHDVTTHQGVNLHQTPMIDVYTKFGLEEGTRDFIGHALALYSEDSYLKKPLKPTLDRIRLYNRSLARYGVSPYIYTLYGLGELPQAFARLSAVYGGTYMLNRPISSVFYDENGMVQGVVSEGESVKCKAIIADPSYFPNKVKKTGQVIRCICILTQPIPETHHAESCQIIIPQHQVNRKHDIYISCVGSRHKVCSEGYYLAMVSTIKETQEPEKEIDVALLLLGPIKEK